MQSRFRKAREDRGLSTKEVADRMRVNDRTITSWDRGTRRIPSDRLAELADLLECTTDYLLGYGDRLVPLTEVVPREKLIVMHDRPVWLASYGWALVNMAKKALTLTDGSSIDLDMIDEPVYSFPPALALSLFGAGPPMPKHEVQMHTTVWVEPITIDKDLSDEMRGWYHVQDRYVVNEFERRYYFDTYGVKWLPFEDCLPESARNLKDNPEPE